MRPQAATHFNCWKFQPVAEKDVAGPFLKKVPNMLEEMRGIPKLNYTSPKEALAETFHIR
jgi:hypothetical protein